MRKILLFIFVVATLVSGCSTTENATKSVDSISPYFNGSTGIVYIAALVEIKSNFSSLMFDKTKAKATEKTETAYAKLGSDAIFHVLPAKVTTPYRTHYDSGTQTILRNYIVLNKFGNVTEDSNKNDFFVIAHINESFQDRFGENYSIVEVTIVDRNNLPYFHTRVKMVSKSDKNFWYYPEKEAKPVSYLTMKGMDYLLRSSLNNAFQES